MTILDKRQIIIVLALVVFSLTALTGCNSETEVNNYSLALEENNMEDCQETGDEATLASGENRGDQEPREPLVFTAGEFAGQYMPTDIKGSYTFADTSAYFEIPLSVLAEAYLIPETEAASFQNKYLKYLYAHLDDMGKEIGNGSVAMFVSMYKDIPFEPHEPTFLLEPGVEILKNLGHLSESNLQYIKEHTVTMDEVKDISFYEFEFIEEAYHEDDIRISSNTTFQYLIDNGVTEDQIKNVLGTNEMPGYNEYIRDYCVLNRLQFSHIKEEFYIILYSIM